MITILVTWVLLKAVRAVLSPYAAKVTGH